MIKHLLIPVLLLTAIVSKAQDTIVPKDLPIAGRIFGLQFTQAEVDSMYGAVKELRRDVDKMHALPLPNNVPMSLWQSPLLPGMQQTERQQAVQWSIPANVSLPPQNNGLAFYNLLQLASLVKNKKITSVQLTRYFISRLKKYSDTLQCTISITEELAMAQAKQADAEIAKGQYRGLLHGIPYGLKDLFAVKGTKTTWGAAPYKNQLIDEDSYVYTKLKEAGAVLVAKFTLGALAMGDKWFGGRTNNPWNLKHGSSGSSAGSAAATVAGLVPFAIGTETWGSIISPSTSCGATGLRPTFGSISRSGGMVLSWSLDKVGPICRSAEDAAIVFYYLHGTDGKDESAVSRAFNYQQRIDTRKLKIAYAKNYFDKLKKDDPEWAVLESYRSMGINPVPVNFPEEGAYNFDMMGIIISAESAAAFDELTRSNKDDLLTWQTKNDWPNQFRTARFVSAVDYINANRHRYLLMQKVNDTLSGFDAVICPTWGGNQCAITNLTGHPAVSLPIGFGKENLPQSITLVGNLYAEARLLAIAKLYQDNTGWQNSHPAMFLK
ncbi:amidase [Foetidibacter luteolus]|uniref:amidase n=1 Tax=Foetidibacter luteolus TaxID=2608880 RepID=UPI00129AD074|nr:amidase [Foetidibacter luteolus]